MRKNDENTKYDLWNSLEKRKYRKFSFWSLTANPHILNGTTSTKHMMEDLKILEFQLTNDEVKEIYNLF